MRFALLKILSAVVAVAITQGVLANGPPPYSVLLDCDPDLSIGNPPLEPFKGKSKMQMVYLGNETFCYRIKFKCDKKLSGFLEMGCFCDPNIPGADGGAGGFFRIVAESDPPERFCDGGFAHLRNSEFTHNCSFDDADASLRVEAVEGRLCSDLPEPSFPDP